MVNNMLNVVEMFFVVNGFFFFRERNEVRMYLLVEE